MSFPSWHDMSRWPVGGPTYSANNPTPMLRKLGAYGQDVEFSALPTTVQVQWLADLAGVVDLSREDELSVGSLFYQTEACGSPGETANDPALGHKYGGRYGEPKHLSLTTILVPFLDLIANRGRVQICSQYGRRNLRTIQLACCG
eukprot:SAG11_NODE_999_length_6236_cov_3.256477_3_plen_145_part_00